MLDIAGFQYVRRNKTQTGDKSRSVCETRDWRLTPIDGFLIRKVRFVIPILHL